MDATLTTLNLVPDIIDKRRVYFVAYWVAANFNAVTVNCKLPASIEYGGLAKYIIIHRVETTYNAAAPPATVQLAAALYDPSGASPLQLTFAYWVPALAGYQARVDELNAVSAIVGTNTTHTVLAHIPSVYDATDDITTRVWGEIILENIDAPIGILPPVQPVSLEGYKWPLTRR